MLKIISIDYSIDYQLILLHEIYQKMYLVHILQKGNTINTLTLAHLDLSIERDLIYKGKLSLEY